MNKILLTLAALPNLIKRRVKFGVQCYISPIFLSWKVKLRFRSRAIAKPHELIAPLIISLTSYPPRFSELPLTIKCLLSQSMAADRVILWIAHEDKNELTPAILNLQKEGLEIAYCENLRSYKKIIPTLKHYPECFIVTADDDLYYSPTWLAEMVQSYEGNPKEVICHRAHQICLGKNGLPLPYMKWEAETECLEASPLIFQTGGGGALYPPGIFHPDVQRTDLFAKLCPDGDDVWLYWMMRLNGGVARKIGIRHDLYMWPSTRKSALFHKNIAGGGNDYCIQMMIEKYDFVS